MTLSLSDVSNAQNYSLISNTPTSTIIANYILAPSTQAIIGSSSTSRTIHSFSASIFRTTTTVSLLNMLFYCGIYNVPFSIDSGTSGYYDNLNYVCPAGVDMGVSNGSNNMYTGFITYSVGDYRTVTSTLETTKEKAFNVLTIFIQFIIFIVISWFVIAL